MGSVLIRVITAPKPQDFNSTRLSQSSQSKFMPNHLTKLNLQDSKDEDKDFFNNSPKTSLQRFFVSSFLREFSESPTKIHISPFRGAVR